MTAATKVCPVCEQPGVGDPASCDHTGAMCVHCGANDRPMDPTTAGLVCSDRCARLAEYRR